MKYNHIAGTLKWAETPDTQEGIFLQPEEATAIDSALAAHTLAAEDASTLVTTQANRIQELEQQVATANDHVTTATNDLATANTRIGELETEVATLSKEDGTEGAIANAPEADAFENKAISANDMDFQKELFAKLN